MVIVETLRRDNLESAVGLGQGRIHDDAWIVRGCAAIQVDLDTGKWMAIISRLPLVDSPADAR